MWRCDGVIVRREWMRCAAHHHRVDGTDAAAARAPLARRPSRSRRTDQGAHVQLGAVRPLRQTCKRTIYDHHVNTIMDDTFVTGVTFFRLEFVWNRS